MNIFPAIDLYEGRAVRLYKGDYQQMTVYDPEPLNTAKKFEAAGARYLHMVDLEGAKTGGTPTPTRCARSSRTPACSSNWAAAYAPWRSSRSTSPSACTG